MKHSVVAADRVLVGSAFSAQRLADLAGVDPSKVLVTYTAPSLPSVPFVPMAARDASIVILGSHFPHKRTEQAVTWAQRFMKTPAGSGLGLVVTGRLGPAAECQCVDDRTERVRQRLSGLELAQLLAGCRVLVFGSVYEGFGLPPVEAVSLGTPATYQRIGAMAEVLARWVSWRLR